MKQHKRLPKTKLIAAGAGAAAIAAAAIILPNANASQSDQTRSDAAPEVFTAAEAGKLASVLEDKFGSSIAGAFWDKETGNLTVNVVDQSVTNNIEVSGDKNDVAVEVKKAGAKVQNAKNSTAALKAGAQTLKTKATIPGTAWAVDPKTNQLLVTADSTVSGAKWNRLESTVKSLGTGMARIQKSTGTISNFTAAADTALRHGAGSDGGAADGGAAAGAADGGAAAGAVDGGAADGGAAAGAADGGAAAGAADGGAADGGGAGAAADAPEGGDAIFGGDVRCSLGFNVKAADGSPAFLTAGHCGVAADTWSDSQDAAPTATVDAATFPGDGDFSLVRYDDPNTQAASEVNTADPAGAAAGKADAGAQTVEINAAADATVGQDVERMGSTSGLHGGQVLALDATVNYPEGTVTGLIETNVCAEPGDSGGAMFSKDGDAIGLTSGGSGDCKVGGETFFQPVTTALQATGATLGDGAGAGGAAAAGNDGGAAVAGNDGGAAAAGNDGGAAAAGNDGGAAAAGNDGGAAVAGNDGGAEDAGGAAAAGNTGGAAGAGDTGGAGGVGENQGGTTGQAAGNAGS